MAQPEQLLDETDESSGIKVRQHIIRTGCVLVTGEKVMNRRQVKGAFKKWGSIDDCCQLGDDRKRYILTFSNYEGEKRF